MTESPADPVALDAVDGAAEGAHLPDLAIITGMSGAGRSTTANVLEDLGWFVVDNLPPALLPTLAELGGRSRGDVARMAAVVDVRSRAFFADLTAALAQLAADGSDPRIIFLEASDDSLVRRHEAVRRPHPLQGDGRLVDGIAREREMLRDLRAEADIVLDTTDLNVHELGAKVLAAFDQDEPGLHATVMSFGFKYGLPVDADLVVDCRFLPNPHWVPELRPLNGTDEPVRAYVMAQQGADEFLDTYERLLDHHRRRLPARGEAVRHDRRRLHRRQAPLGRHDRGARAPARRPRGRGVRRPPRPGSRVTGAGGRSRPSSRWVEVTGWRPRCRRSAGSPTGRPRSSPSPTTAARAAGSARELGVLPPGDLRMALAALCGDDEWGRTWSEVVQHRFRSEGELHEHSLGNLLIVALWELLDDSVSGLDWVARLLGVAGPGAADVGRAAGHRGRGDVPGCRSGRARRAGAGARAGRGRDDRRSGARRPPAAREPAGLPAGRGGGAGRRLGRPRARARGSPACCRTCSCPSWRPPCGPRRPAGCSCST